MCRFSSAFLFLLFLFLLPLTVFSVPSYTLFDEVPAQYQDSFHLTSPESKFITSKSVISIRGQNRFLTSTFINGSKIRLQEDGQFYYELKFSRFGKQYFYLSFLNAQSEILVLRRKLLVLWLPPDIDLYGHNRSFYVLFMNTNLIYNPKFKKTLSDVVTRADLAYFIYQLLKKPAVSFDALPSDVSTTFYSKNAILYCLSNGILPLQEGVFKPDTAVSKLEAMTAITTALGLTSSESMPFNLNSEAPESGQVLTFSTFIDLVSSLPLVKAEISNLEDFSTGFPDSESDSDWISFLDPLVTVVSDKQELLKSSSRLVFDSPEPSSVVLGGSVLVSGKISPPQKFYVNQSVITPNASGGFSKRFFVSPGKQVFKVKSILGDRSFFVYVLPTYSDLKGHWFESTASKLKYIQFLPDAPVFNPSMPVSRLTAATYLYKVYSYTKLSSYPSSVVVSDLPKGSGHEGIVSRLVYSGVFTLDSSKHFFPNDSMTRGEVVTVLVRAAEKLDPASLSINRLPFPYWDIPVGHPLRPILIKGLSLGILIPSYQFNPDKLSNRAEFFSMLSKLPPLSKKLNFDQNKDKLPVKPLDLDSTFEGDETESKESFHPDTATDPFEELIDNSYELNQKN